MTTMLCPTTDRLKAFYLGQLPDEQSDELVSHVGTLTSHFQLGKSFVFDIQMGTPTENLESSFLVVFSIDWLHSQIGPANADAASARKSANNQDIDRSSVMIQSTKVGGTL